MQFKYKLLVLSALIVVIGLGTSILDTSTEIAELQKQNLSASAGLFDWLKKDTRVANPTIVPDGDQRISARKCKRLGGELVWGTSYVDNNTGQTHIEPTGVNDRWHCVVSGNSIASIPDEVDKVMNINSNDSDNVSGEPVDEISRRRCRKLGGEVVLAPSEDNPWRWYCVFPVDSVNTIYDNYLGLLEPINETTIKSYDMLLELEQKAGKAY